MKNKLSRRKFLKNTALTGAGISMLGVPLAGYSKPAAGKRVGIIGLDTSHVVAFTKVLNEQQSADYQGYKIVAAYPQGSPDIEVSVSRMPQFRDQVKEMGVEIVDSIAALLEKVDVVLLETNDGRPHLEQAIPVMKAGKTLFIDKPIAASLTDAITIFKLAENYKVPIFSASSLRYTPNILEVRQGKIGKVLGADAYSPCALEETHPDLFWYGVHGVEILYTVMGTGCVELKRTHTKDTDVVVGTWEDGRIGTFRGTRTGKHTYGGTAYGEEGDAVLGPYAGYEPLLKEITKFFDSGIPPIEAEETIEMFTFMEAADESRLNGGGKVSLEQVYKKALGKANNKLAQLI